MTISGIKRYIPGPKKIMENLWILRCLSTGRFHAGFCPVCNERTFFFIRNSWLRDYYLCIKCRSIPRHRALIRVLKMLFPGYADMAIHESSPGGASSTRLAIECRRYLPTHFFPEVAPGSSKYDIRCENLENMTFPDNSFDLVITQDVFEHVLHPGRAFQEIARTLKPGGCHVFTVPYYYWQNTVVRAEETPQGIRHLQEKVYHGNPISQEGSLVVTDWGEDLADFIFRHSAMTTTIYMMKDHRMGLDGEFLEVFVSRKKNG